jgi:hypothetical protein
MQQPYTVWIEVEEWSPGTWTPQDANTDVTVTFADGSVWVATFVTYTNIQTLVAKNKRTGECLAGAYFWASNMILIDEVSRPRIEQVIRALIDEGEFDVVFAHAPDETP